MVNQSVLCIEGGGSSKNEKIAFRKGWKLFLENAGFSKRLPRVIPGGGRTETFRDFRILSTGKSGKVVLLLVDSEEPIHSSDFELEADAVWKHLKARDNWEKPTQVENNQCALMATCMETWFIADPKALQQIFGAKLNLKALPTSNKLEQLNRKDVLHMLELATEPCGRDKGYKKGERSYKILEVLDGKSIRIKLPHCDRFLKILDQYLK